MNLETAYEQLFNYCESEDFAGYDPYDALNSRIFQTLPFNNLALPRLIWLQTVKRSPINLRPFLKIKKGTNAKGIALFALAELTRFRTNYSSQHAENAKQLLKNLETLKIKTQHSALSTQHSSFGYNFDWQSRAFFAPLGTPTIVPTAFAARAFLEGYALFDDENYLETAKEVCDFILEDLNRSFESETEICFSYTPLDNSIIFNASLLAGECLAEVGKITNDENLLKTAAKTAQFVLNRQKENGGWAYGSKLRHAWIDNFHTAYILLSLYRLQKIIPNLEKEPKTPIKKGLDFWLENFFLEDGTPKYYDKQTLPIDIHSASAAIVALCELDEIDKRCLPLAEIVANWTIENMRDKRGFFYYQKRRFQTVKTPFIRWAQAWTAYALASLIEKTNTATE